MNIESDTVALLIRHAHTDAVGRWLAGRAPGVHLSEAGRAQAARLGTALARVDLAAIYSSPRERARETAVAIARHRASPLHVHDGLDEVDFGAWTGRTFAELEADPRWRDFNTQRGSAAVPGGEPAPAVQQRIVAVIARLAALHPGRTFALVSHADVLRAAVLHYAETPMDRYFRFEISPASVTAVAFADAEPRLVYVNNRCHATDP